MCNREVCVYPGCFGLEIEDSTDIARRCPTFVTRHREEKYIKMVTAMTGDIPPKFSDMKTIGKMDLVRKTILDWIRNKQRKSIYISAGPGAGKTMVSLCAMREIVLSSRIDNYYIIGDRQLCQIIMSHIRQDREQYAYNELLKSDILILDNFGAGNMTDNQQLYITDLVNAKKGLLIINSRYKINELPYDTYLKDALQYTCQQLYFTAVDYRKMEKK